MPDWDEILVGDGIGVHPAIYAFARADGLEQSGIENMFEALVERASMAQVQRRPGLGPGIKLVAVFYFNAINSTTAKRISRLAPKRFHEGLKPQVWVVRPVRPKVIRPSGHPHAVAVERGAGSQPGPAGGGAGSGCRRFRPGVRTEYCREPARRLRGDHSSQRALRDLRAAGRYLVRLSTGNAGAGGSMSNNVLLEYGGLQPALVQKHEWWLLFTTMFVHAGLLHIGSNSIALYSVGTLVERVYGHAKYALIYFASGLFASAASLSIMFLRGEFLQVAVGASGAIFGIAGVVIALGVRKDSVVPRAVALQLSVFMLVLIGVNIAYDFFTPQIDISAHIGGLAIGFILGYLLAPTHRPESRGVAREGQELLR